MIVQVCKWLKLFINVKYVACRIILFKLSYQLKKNVTLSHPPLTGNDLNDFFAYKWFNPFAVNKSWNKRPGLKYFIYYIIHLLQI
jgi:hypothetical protein